MLTRDQEIGRSLRKADPEARALLDLSLRRRVKDDVIAAVLRLQPEEVAPRREAALDRLAWDLGIHDRGQARQLARRADRARRRPVAIGLRRSRPAVPRLPEGRGSGPCGRAPPAGEGARDRAGPCVRPSAPPAYAPAAYEPAAEPAADTPPETRPPQAPEAPPPPAADPAGARAGRSALGAVLGFVLIGSSDDDTKSSASSAPATTSAPAPKPVALEPLVDGLPGTAEPRWSTAPAPIAASRSRCATCLPGRRRTRCGSTTRSGTIACSTAPWAATSTWTSPCPPTRTGTASWTSRVEPIDGNPNHSGASVLRVPLADLTR